MVICTRPECQTAAGCKCSTPYAFTVEQPPKNLSPPIQQMRSFDQFGEISPERISLMRIVELLERIDRRLEQLELVARNR